MKNPSNERIIPQHDMHARDFASDEAIFINSCGSQIHDSENIVSRPTGRADYHLLFITEGGCVAKINEVTVNLSAGDLLFYRPGEPQWYSFCKGRCASFWLHISGTSVGALCDMAGMSEGHIFQLSDLKAIERIHMKLIIETQSKQKGYQLFVQSYVQQLFAQIYRQLGENDPSSVSTVTDERILRVLNVLDRLYYRPLDIEQLAAECNVGRDRFLHLFTKTVGVPPQKYVTALRIKNAKRYLAESDLLVTEIAERCGYPDSMYFSRVFRKQTGLPPTEYRKVYSK